MIRLRMNSSSTPSRRLSSARMRQYLSKARMIMCKLFGSTTSPAEATAVSVNFVEEKGYLSITIAV